MGVWRYLIHMKPHISDMKPDKTQHKYYNNINHNITFVRDPITSKNTIKNMQFLSAIIALNI
jgi:hypothetical protein